MNNQNQSINDLALQLIKKLKTINYPTKVLIKMLLCGNADIFLPIIHYTFFNYSEYVKNFLIENKFEIYAKNDIDFIEMVFKILNNLFDYKPTFSSNQFFKNGYSYEKILFCINLIDMVKIKNKELKNKNNTNQITDSEEENENDDIKIDENNINLENVKKNSPKEIYTKYSNNSINNNNNINNINNENNLVNNLSIKYISLINVIVSLKDSIIDMINKINDFKDTTEKRLNNLEYQVNILNSRQNLIDTYFLSNNIIQKQKYDFNPSLNNNFICNKNMNYYNKYEQNEINNNNSNYINNNNN